MISHHAVSSGVASEHVIGKLVLFDESLLGLLSVVGLFVDEVVLEEELVSHHAGSSGIASEHVIGGLDTAGSEFGLDIGGPEIVSHHDVTSGVGSEEVISGLEADGSVFSLGSNGEELVTHHAVTSFVASEVVVVGLDATGTVGSLYANGPEFVSETLNECHGLIILVFHSILDEVFLEGELVSHHAGSSGVASEDIVGEHIVKFIN